MKKKALLILLIASSVFKAQTVIPAVYNTSIIADGILSPGEWLQSSSVTIAAPGNTITYKVAYDNTKLYFVCYGKLETANSLFPEVLLDVNNSKSVSWQNDDWWLHVSATDCENKGSYGVYNNCAATQPDWIGIPNFSPGAPMTDTIEMSINWFKLNFNPQSGNDIGISLLVTNTFNLWHYWPTQTNRNNPSTWGILDFTVNTTELKGHEVENGLTIYPNPSKGNVTIVHTGKPIPQHIVITDLLGQVIKDEIMQNSTLSFELTERGVYFIRVETNDNPVIITRKLIVD